MHKKSKQIWLCAVLAVGMLASLVLCGIRAGMEARDRSVAVVMTQEAADAIGGLPEGVQLADGRRTWVSIRTGDGIPLGEEKARLEAFYARPTAEYFPPSVPVAVLVEDDSQFSYVPDGEVDALLETLPVNGGGCACVRCFHLTEKYAARYHTLGYAGAEEIENILYRAVTDRNIRMLWLEPFTDAETGETVTDGEVYAQLLQNLSARLARHGLTVGPYFSVFPGYTPNVLLLMLTAFGAAAAGVLLLKTGFGLKEKRCLPLLAVCCVLAAAALLLRRDTAVMLLAFASAVIYPCLALTYAERRFESAQEAPMGRTFSGCAGSLAVSFLIALAGGLAVGALQSSTEWLLAVRNFRGVKLSSLLPLVYAAYIVLRRLCTPREILRGRRVLTVFAVLVLAAAAAVFLLRTGDGALSVSTLEQRFRNALETRFLVRPRSKEFLIAWPCFGIAYALCCRGARRWAWPFAILTATGFSSVVNTFCHSRAPLWLSALRGVYGLLPGMALALVFCALLHRPADRLKN